VIEVAGTPGAGKTTVARALVEELRAAGMSASTIVEAARTHAQRTAAGRVVVRVPHHRLRRLLLWWVFYLSSTVHGAAFAFRHRELVRHVARACRARRGAGDAVGRTHARFWFFHLCGRVAFLRATARPGETLVLDDGFLHRAVHLHASTSGEVDVAAVREYVSLVPSPDLVACLAVPESSCRARVVARGVWPHARDLDDAGLTAYLASARTVTDAACDRARQLGWRAVTIANDGRIPADVVDDVRRELDRLPRPTPSAARERARIPHVPRPSRVRAIAAGRFGPPALSPDRVQEVLERYALAANAHDASDLRIGRRSLNAAVPTPHGTKVVKQYRPQWTEPLVLHGHSILLRLEERAFPAVRLTRAPDGGTHTVVDGAVYAVFDFVDGTSFSLNFLRRSDRLALAATAGTTLACMHDALDGFVPHGPHHLGFTSPTGPRARDVGWHVRKLDELSARSATRLPADTVEPLRVLRARSDATLARIAQLERELAGVELPKLVVHGDYGLHNLVFQSTARAVVVDFESARLDWRVNDLVSALGKYRARRDRRYDVEAMETFLRAYTETFPLRDGELDVLLEVWELYRLRSAVQYWNSYFETEGPVRKLWSAVDALEQADWAAGRPATVAHLVQVATATARTTGERAS
jgi:Ser/Thr protein kinase RdoA (MazF antagonist)/thymidylate kinase